jgi:hypothetical protein
MSWAWRTGVLHPKGSCRALQTLGPRLCAFEASKLPSAKRPEREMGSAPLRSAALAMDGCFVQAKAALALAASGKHAHKPGHAHRPKHHSQHAGANAAGARRSRPRGSRAFVWARGSSIREYPLVSNALAASGTASGPLVLSCLRNPSLRPRRWLTVSVYNSSRRVRGAPQHQ